MSVELSAFQQFNKSSESFHGIIQQIVSRDGVPPWFREFSESLNTFINEVGGSINKLENNYMQLQGDLAIQKAITDGLDNDRTRLQLKIDQLEADLEEQRQYSRRTNILIHGCAEKPNEDTEQIVLDVIEKLQLPISRYEIGRTHRLGGKVEGKIRPIIVRFVSYRQKKMTYDAKKGLKGSRILITESLTKERYSLFRYCVDTCGRDNVWTLDGRIYCATGNKDCRGRSEKIVVTRKEDLSDVVIHQ